MVKPPIFPPTRPEDVFGSLRTKVKPKTLGEMDEAVLAEAARLYAEMEADCAEGSEVQHDHDGSLLGVNDGRRAKGSNGA